ncbi:hypothetical protein SAMN05421858_4311 [Haladaptatus litoreus]|uniref:Uncharacterized protein n=1 Tax=Haladaptatus litoreus TaxID=553468 RepID=A0A1N7EJM5_9EURY|nr:hypothetical protein [Haladaptatus litoreus]SIR88293.1 hypothetical protein SAMN05421858_4311 [Haladaptatus litoreus]
MTDAEVPVTQSTVERFTERYLRSIGCSIKRSENHWVVTVPDGTETDLSAGSHTLACGKDSDQVDNAEHLNPESEFFQRILREAIGRSPTGKLSIGGETDVELPDWIQNSAVEVRNAQFTPYYDRTAAVFLFRIGIETVSEYQQEFLRAVAMDARSEEHLPKLEDTFLEVTSIDAETDTNDRSHFTETDVQPLLDMARDLLLDGIEERIDEIHREASRAADAEVEEYRQMQQQRIQELEEEHSNLSSKINELSEAINTGDPDARVQALKKRKELKSEYDDIGDTLNELRERRDKGFPEQQREIRKRHSLDVQVTPLTVTEVEYEQGEVDLELTKGKTKRIETIGYGVGIGITDTVRCSSCGQELTKQNPLHTIEEGVRCMECIENL